jgi:hypothetical protein
LKHSNQMVISEPLISHSFRNGVLFWVASWSPVMGLSRGRLCGFGGGAFPQIV